MRLVQILEGIFHMRALISPKKTTTKSMTLAAASVLALGVAAPALASDVIVVTAQKREQSIIDVPAAVSAVSAEQLQNAGVARLDDLASSFPNVYINTDNSLRTTTITIRGISSNPNNPGVDQGVGVFVDGVYQSRPTTINTNVYDLERVEVIRGPQGALYGKNTIAGAINMISKLPGDATSVEGAVNLGNFDALALFGAADIVLNDAVKARFSVSSQRRDGFTENLVTGSDLDDVDELSGRFAIVLQPAESLQLIWRGDMAENRTNMGSSEVLANGVLSGTPLADAAPDDRIVANDHDTVQDRDLWGTSLQADLTLGAGVLTSLTAYRNYQWLNAADNDFTALNQLRSGIREDQEQVSQELRFASNLGERFDYLFGGYFLNEKLDTVSNAVIGPDLGVYPTETPIDIFANLETTSYALFAQGGYRFNDQFGLSAAIRWSKDEKEVTHSSSGDPFSILLPTSPERSISREDSEWTPSASLNWTPNDNALVYASYSRGYKSGGYNAFSITPTDDAEYAPEFVNSYEIGAKSSFADGAVYVAAAAFLLDYKDLQVNQLINVGGVPTFTTSNAAKAESWGIELEGSWRPVDQLDLGVSYGYLNGEFDDFQNATSGGDDYSGNRLPEAPKHTLSVNGDFRQPLSGAIDFVGHADMTYRSALFFDASNNPDFVQDGVALVNLRAGLAASDDSWSIVMWARNLTDETYAVSRSGGVIIPGQQIQSLGAPRTWGVELRGRF